VSRKMFKSISSILVLLMIMTLAVSCAKQGPEKPVEQPAEQPTEQPKQTETSETPSTEKPEGQEQVGEVKPNVANDPLKAKVEAGELPPLDQRLPEKPIIVNVREAIGTYGGEIVTWHEGTDAGHIKMWLYDPPIRWKEDYSGYEPGFCEKVEWSEDGRTITYTLRAGLKWSDGHPFTTEDIRYWWEDLANYPDSGYQPPWWSFNADGSTMEVKILNETQFQFIFKEPNWIQPYILAQGNWEWDALMKPKHYLSQFHPKYNKEITDFVLHREKDNYITNPDFPTIYAWVTKIYEDGVRIVLERNPYYWKLDPEGNQLPYIDRIIALRVDDEETRVLKALQGEFDLSIRGINPRNIPVLHENQEKGNYKLLMWSNGAGGWPGMLVNQDHVGDEYIRQLLRDKRFRRAVSVAIDRENINEAIWNGLGTVQQGTITKESPHFATPEGQELFKQWQEFYSQYDPDLANKLLDEIGLTQRDAKGFRLRPDGKPLELVIDVTGWGLREINATAAQLIKQDLEKVGLKVEIRDIPSSEEGVRFNSAEWMFSFAHAAELDLWTYPDWVFPLRGNRAWPLQGRWFETGGKEGEEPYEGSPAKVLNDLYHKGRSLKSEEERHKVVHEAVKYILEEGPFYIGITGGIPEPVIARKNLKNVPQYGVLGPWAPGSPGNLNIITIFWEK